MVHGLETMKQMNDLSSLKSVSRKHRDIETRVTQNLAVQRYVRAVERFEASCKDFNEACQNMRKVLGNPDRFVAQVDGFTYLVTANENGDFEVEKVETL